MKIKVQYGSKPSYMLRFSKDFMKGEGGIFDFFNLETRGKILKGTQMFLDSGRLAKNLPSNAYVIGEFSLHMEEYFFLH